MAVTYDAVGPSSAGLAGSGSPTTWSHTAAVGAALLVGAVIDVATPANTCTATYGGVSMTLLGSVNVAAGNDGFLYVFGLANAGNGSAQNVVVTYNAAADVEAFGSISFGGAASTNGAAFGSFQSATAASGTETLACSTTSASSRIAGFLATGGATITGMSAGTSRFFINQGSAGFCGSAAGGDAPGTGGTVTLTFSGDTADSWGIGAVEVLPPGGGGGSSMPPQPGSRNLRRTHRRGQQIWPPALSVSAAIPPLPVIVLPPLALTPLASAAPSPQVITAPLQSATADTAAAADALSVLRTNSLPVVIVPPVQVPVSSVAAVPRVITAPLLASQADAAAAAEVLSVAQTNSLPVVVQATQLAPLVSPAPAPQVITGQTTVTVISLADVAAGIEIVSVAETNSLPVVVLPPVVNPLPAPPQPAAQVITAPLQSSTADVAASADALQVAQANSLPVVVAPPYLVPMLSPAARPQVITAPLSATQLDVAAAVEAIVVTQTNSLPVVVQPPLALVPVSSPAPAPSVITGPAAIVAVNQADVAAAVEALQVAQTNSLPVVVLPPLVLPVPAPPQPQPQIIVAPLQSSTSDVAAAAEALAVTQNNSLPVIVSPPVALVPVASRAAPAQVITGPTAIVAVNQSDVAAAAEAFIVLQTNSLPVVVMPPLVVPLPPALPPQPQVITAPLRSSTADVAAAAEALAILQANSLPVVIIAPVLQGLTTVPPGPQVILSPAAAIPVTLADVAGAADATTVSVSVPLADAGGSVDASLPTTETLFYVDLGAAAELFTVSVAGLKPEANWFAQPVAPAWTARPQAPQWIAAAEPATWTAKPVPPTWQARAVPPTWRVVMVNFQPIAAVSLEYVNANWTAECAGVMIDPTGQTAGQPQLAVQFAFPVSSGNVLKPAEPVTWYAGAWLLATTSTGFIAQCLVGTGGALTLTAGVIYDVWSMVTSSPEIPRKFVGQQPVY